MTVLADGVPVGSVGLGETFWVGNATIDGSGWGMVLSYEFDSTWLLTLASAGVERTLVAVAAGPAGIDFEMTGPQRFRLHLRPARV